MTVLEAPATVVGPTVRSVGRSARGPLLVVVALVLTGIGVAAYNATGARGFLDPAAYDPQGSHAIAALLEHRGVPVRRVETPAALRSDASSTVFVPIAAALTAEEMARLPATGARLVVVGASGPQLASLDAGVEEGADVEVATREPACSLRAAAVAGDVDIGGVTYRPDEGSTGCYASAGRAALVDVPQRRMTLLGSADLFTNARLDKHGNAALALHLLGAGTDVQWLLPRPGARDDHSTQSLNDLVPRALKLAVLQLFVAAAVLALWRARRLGPVVSEPLPVVVRAAEAIEGRSRLYRAARARQAAAEALRAGARDRLARRLGLGPDSGLDSGRAALVAAVVARTAGDPAAVDALLYGAAPTDDDALVLLADDLDILILEVAGS